MTETVCPTCGAKCEVSEGRCLKECDYHCAKLHLLNYQTIPQPDLTKLREAWKVFEHNMRADKHPNAYICLLEAVKELLEGDKL